VGLLIGPIAGTFVNTNLGGYLPSFLFFAGLLALSGILNIVLLPSSLNRKPVISNEEFKNLGDAAPVKLQYSWFFKNRRALFTLASLSMLSFSVNFKQSFMTTYLAESKLVQQTNIGNVVAISPLF
jgi:MFS family permease